MICIILAFENPCYMSVSLSRVKSVSNICGIELAFTGDMRPSTIEGYQVFNNSIPAGADFQQLYASKTTINFSEESETGNAGTSYKQKLEFRFPSTDASRAERIELIHKVKWIKIKLANKVDFIIGRNDFKQNARPKVKMKSDEKITQITIETVSIFSCGYIPTFDAAGLPILFPISFIPD